LCSAIPYFEKNGFNGLLCCHERAALIIKYYGIKSDFYFINTQEYRYQLKNGSYINFLFAPYLHFPGAIMTYLPTKEILLSGDLFGAFSENWSLYAPEDYEESMKTFHESYMPSHEILAPVMNQLLKYDISIICPQHGSIINKNVTSYINILRDLPCGVLLRPVKKNLIERGGILSLCNEILKRYFALFRNKEIRRIFPSNCQGKRNALDYNY